MTSSGDRPAASPAADSPPPEHHIARGTKFKLALVWSYVVSVGVYAITAIVTFVLAAILSPEDFGLLWMSLVWITLAQILLQHGPTIAVVQHDDITDVHLDAAFWSTLVGACLFAVLLAAAAPLWAAFQGIPQLTAILLVLTAIVPLYALNVIPEAVLRRQMQMRGIALRYLASGVGAGAAATVCALAGMGVWALVVHQVGMTLINTVLLWLMIPWRPRLRRFGRELRDIRGTSGKTLFGALGDFVVARADVLLMGTFFGPAVVGLFRFALRVPDLVMDVTARGLHEIALPDLARHGRDSSAMVSRLSQLVRIGVALSVPALGVIAACAEPFVLFIGQQWRPAIRPMQILCLAVAIAAVGRLFIPTLQAAQRPGLPAILTWVSAAFTTVGLLLAAYLTAEAAEATQLLSVAWALVAVDVLITLMLGFTVFAVVLRASPWPVIRAIIPGAAAAGIALLSGAVTRAVLTGGATPVLVELVLTALVSGMSAVGFLLLTDRELRSWFEQLWRRVRPAG